MDAKELMGFRPASPASGDIEAAMHRLNTAVADRNRMILEHRARRPRLLLEGTEAEIDAATAEQNRLKLDVEQLELLQDTLPEALQEALRRDHDDCIKRLHDAATAKRDKFVEAWREKYGPAAWVIRELLEMEVEFRAAVKAYQDYSITVPTELRPVQGPPNQTPAQILSGVVATGDLGMIQIGNSVCLPGENACPQFYGDRIVVGSPSNAIWWPDRRPIPQWPV